MDGLTLKVERSGAAVALKLLHVTSLPTQELTPAQLIQQLLATNQEGYPPLELAQNVLGMIAARYIAQQGVESGRYRRAYALPISLITNNLGHIIGYVTPWVEGNSTDTISASSLASEEYQQFNDDILTAGVEIDSMDVARNAIVVGGVPLAQISREGEAYGSLRRSMDLKSLAINKLRAQMSKLAAEQDMDQDVFLFYPVSEVEDALANSNLQASPNAQIMLSNLKQLELERAEIAKNMRDQALQNAQAYAAQHQLDNDVKVDEYGFVQNIPAEEVYILDLGVRGKANMVRLREMLGFT